mmetsp:Transcript_46970/g.69548  ORF Transcript_46970/g.69548 Transcript_46970/m.69548 type:complete len:541 (+) Transcript_46970:38-1660(+)
MRADEQSSLLMAPPTTQQELQQQQRYLSLSRNEESNNNNNEEYFEDDTISLVRSSASLAALYAGNDSNSFWRRGGLTNPEILSNQDSGTRRSNDPNPHGFFSFINNSTSRIRSIFNFNNNDQERTESGSSTLSTSRTSLGNGTGRSNSNGNARTRTSFGENQEVTPATDEANRSNQTSTTPSISSDLENQDEGGAMNSGGESTTTVLPRLSPDSESDDDFNGINENDVTTLTHRLRCLFAILTCPIVPLAASLTLLLLWVFYAAIVLDWGKPCDQPLRLYSLLSALMFAYTPHHRSAKRLLFGYWRERDGPVRPWNVRMYDQLYHALCLLWMYAGITWISNCDTCKVDSPHLYNAVRIFVFIQTVFMSILVVPLLCLPCIYLWLVRQASIISAGRGSSHNRRRKKHDPDKVLASMATLSPEDFDESNIPKECCICMSELTRGSDNNEGDLNTDGAVKTRCGHVFHKACLKTWLESSYGSSCCCPLCRKDLVPDENESNSTQATTSETGHSVVEPSETAPAVASGEAATDRRENSPSYTLN